MTNRLYFWSPDRVEPFCYCSLSAQLQKWANIYISMKGASITCTVWETVAVTCVTLFHNQLSAVPQMSGMSLCCHWLYSVWPLQLSVCMKCNWMCMKRIWTHHSCEIGQLISECYRYGIPYFQWVQIFGIFTNWLTFTKIKAVKIYTCVNAIVLCNLSTL